MTQENLQNGLVAHYPFNGNAKDESGNGNDGEVHLASLTQDRFGKQESSYSFDGQTSFIKINNGTQFNFANDMSISIWVKPSGNQGNSAGIIDKSHCPGNTGWAIEQSGTTTNFYYFIYRQSSPDNWNVGSNLQLVANAWSHVAITKQNTIVTYYINGEQKDSYSVQSPIIKNSGDLPLYLGAEYCFGGISRYFSGSLDDIRIYSKSLTISEIQQLYHYTELTFGLIAYYPFHGNAHDESGNGNDGEAHLASLAQDRFGKHESSYSFDGQTSFIKINDGTQFNFANDMSISLWVKPSGNQGNSAGIIDKSHCPGNTGWAIEQSGTTTNFYYFIYRQSSPDSWNVGSNLQLVANAWSHITITKQNTIVTYYINGDQKDSYSVQSSIIKDSGDLPLYLGAEYCFGGVSRYFSGSLDDIRIYNRSLTIVEVHQLYTETLAPTTAPTALPTFVPTALPTVTPTVRSTSSVLQNIELAKLTASQGFSVTVNDKSDGSNYHKISLSKIGDINNDTYADVVIGTSYTGTCSNNKDRCYGTTYIIFGNNTEDLSTLDEQELNSELTITGDTPTNLMGFSVSGGGDVNGDGIDDLIIGAHGSIISINGERDWAGKTFVIFGKDKRTPFTDVSLATTNLYNNKLGFYIIGGAANEQSGYTVDGRGNINNDKFDDIIISAPNQNTFGAVYVIYGQSNFSENVVLNADLASPTLYQGFTIQATSTSGKIGAYISWAGDIDKDGCSDIIIGAPDANSNAGITYVVFGKNYPTIFSNFNLNNINAYGFKITGVNAGDLSGFSVSGGGDINNDGYDDIIIGAYGANSYKGISYVIFGRETNYGEIRLNSLSGGVGFKIIGVNPGDNFGYSVSRAGDVNGDGIDDLLINANGANSGAGITYIIYGKEGLTTSFSDIYLANFTVSQGIIITGANAGDNSGDFVRELGDVNHDGYDDIAISAHVGPSTGRVYIIYGGESVNEPSSSISPTLLPTLLPTFTPTFIPSVLPTSPVRDIKQGGAHTGSAAAETWELNSPDDVYIDTLGSSGAEDIFSIHPHSNVKYTISYFNLDKDKLDLNLFTYLHNKNDLNQIITSGSAIINLANNQTIRIENLSPSIIRSSTADSFMFAPAPTASPTTAPNSSPTDEKPLSSNLNIGAVVAGIGGPTVVGGVIMVFSKTICTWAFDAWNEDATTLPEFSFKNAILFPCTYYSSAYKDDKIKQEERNEQYKNIIKSKPTKNDDKIVSVNKNGHSKIAAILSIDASIHDPNYNKPFEKIAGAIIDGTALKVGQIVNDITKVLPKQFIIEGSNGENNAIVALFSEQFSSNADLSSSYLISSLLIIRSAIEYTPIVKAVYPLLENYLPEAAKNISLPEVLSSKTVLVTAHLATGTLISLSLPEGAVSKALVMSTAGSASFGIGQVTSYYFTEYRKEISISEKQVDITYAAKHCAITIAAYTVPAVATCALVNVVMPGYQCSELDLNLKLSFVEVECYSVYQDYLVSTTSSTATDIAVSCVATAIITYANNYHPMMIAASIITADYLSNLAMDLVPNEIKEDYINSAMNVISETMTNIAGNVYGYFYAAEV